MRTDSALKKIPVAQVRQGMYLHRLGGSWLHTPFWRRAFVLDDIEDLQTLRQSGIEEVWIDISKGLDVFEEAEPGSAPAELLPELESPSVATLELAEVATVLAPPPVLHLLQTPTSMVEELAQARRICSEGREKVVSMFAEVRMGRAIDAGSAMPLVDEIASSVARNPGALISMARLKSRDDYTYMHSVAVCGLMVALANQMGLPQDEVREAGLGGLLHDLGKALMPLKVLNKPGTLTEPEFAIMKTHPEEGWRLLEEGGAVSKVVRQVALHHHEKYDGSGYPQKLAGNDIPLHARMGAICDVYDAVTSERIYKRPWDPAHAVRQMARWQGHFDPTLFQAFIKSLGIYPVGSLVRLESGFLAVVAEQHPDTLLTPVVQVFYSLRSNERIRPRRHDLRASAGTDRITAVEDPQKWPFKDLDTLWQPAA